MNTITDPKFIAATLSVIVLAGLVKFFAWIGLDIPKDAIAGLAGIIAVAIAGVAATFMASHAHVEAKKIENAPEADGVSTGEQQ